MAVWWAVPLVVVGLWLVLYLIPDVLFHHLQVGAFAGSRAEARVGLTFDDGPGPDTPDVLDVLERLGVKGTFFVIAERAQGQSAVLQRLVADGHELGLHMDRHVSAFLLGPLQSYRLVRKGLDTLEGMTGRRPKLFRPPWGHMNLGTWMAVRRFGLVPVYWDIAPDDWKPAHTPEYISHYVVQMAQPGTVVVLHDAGGARDRTVAALPAMIEGLRHVGLEPSPVGSLRHDPSLLHRIWTWWEIRFTRGWDIETIPNSLGGEPYLRIGHIRYRGRPADLGRGVVLSRGDAMGEIHFGNPALSQLSGQATSALRALHEILSAMGDLARWMEVHPRYQDVRAVGGVTLLDSARAIEKLGFRREPVYGWTKWSMWIYLVFLMAIYHRDGWKTLRRFRHLKPVMVLMERQEFVERYSRPRNRGRSPR